LDKFTKEDKDNALKVIFSIINECEKMYPKFAKGTSQHTLLKNRIKAMYIAKTLLSEDNPLEKYTNEDLTEALRPVTSIINKCEKAQLKFSENTSQHTRLNNIIKAMYISKALITEEISEEY
jgi:hypothetical protein